MTIKRKLISSGNKAEADDRFTNTFFVSFHISSETLCTQDALPLGKSLFFMEFPINNPVIFRQHSLFLGYLVAFMCS